ncbi:MAG: hypothetical protein HC879_07300 [Leptolyngbyaceae cyanobacterium SL_5_9]|nr:hypothetical protein [Leptolyngbyaceae cyanobacterium SL_5_9]NJO73178.1 hypothetical protein [Leptolyngbyaceae cyanobacterium RM1_406_9]
MRLLVRPVASDSNQPWLIVAVFPGHHPKVIGRTCNRADADATVRFLRWRGIGGAGQ